MLESSPQGIDLSVVFAPVYWGNGFILSVMLGGISILQGYLYFLNNKDRLSIRLIAAIMLILDLVSLALVAQSVYYYLIPHFGSTVPLGSITTELSVDCLISTIITFISQLYFVNQLFAVLKPMQRWWSQPGVIVTLLVAFFAVCAFVFGVACTAVMVIHKHSVLANKAPAFQLFFGLAKGFGALTDVLATITMYIFLSAARTGIQSTNSIIKSLTHFVINRGLLVTLIQVLLLIIFFAVEDRLYWFAFHVNLTKLYVNTFFAMLNGRPYLNQKLVAHSFHASMHNYQNKVINLDDDSYQLSKHHPYINPTSPLTPAGAYSFLPKEYRSTSPVMMPTVTKTVTVLER